jgi:phage-related protein
MVQHKKIQARFYEMASGNKPVRDWLFGMTKDDCRAVGFDIQTVEFGWPIGMPVCKPLGNGLHEVRSILADGRIGRILFCIIAGEMILLHGFVKKTQRTPLAEMALAVKRMKEIS